VTHKGTHWPVWLFWAGLIVALVSLVDYVRKAHREVRFT
jgi:hypothetical protein